MGYVDQRQEWIVHVTWYDGQKHAKVVPLPTIVEVANFAAKNMGMTILGSDNRPILPLESAAAAGR